MPIDFEALEDLQRVVDYAIEYCEDDEVVEAMIAFNDVVNDTDFDNPVDAAEWQECLIDYWTDKRVKDAYYANDKA